MHRFLYYDRKYAALSLIYRALHGADGVRGSLMEYLASGSGQDGIMDMLDRGIDCEARSTLLLSGADLLRGIVAFHIDAANRSRYAKAAQHMCAIRDIYAYLKLDNEFRGYFEEIIKQNSRRPALRDEMSVVLGKEATKAKK